MVLDYRKMQDRQQFRTDEFYENVTFRHFPNLQLEGARFHHCVFEDCEALKFEACDLADCTFRRVGAIEARRSEFHDCLFAECHGDGPLLSMESSTADGCCFRDMRAFGHVEGYLVDMIFSNLAEVKPLTNCRFEDCRVENEEGMLVLCQYFARTSFFTLEKDCLRTNGIHYRSCKIIHCGYGDNGAEK